MPNEVKDVATYKSMFKANSLLGGLQLYQIIIGILRSKVIAVLLGPEGMGISGLLNSSTLLIKQLSSMGIASSAVRDVSEANGSGDSKRIGYVISVLRKLVWLTGILGLVSVIIFSPVLSKTAFGNYDYTIPFIFLSVTLLFEQLNAGQLALLQGLRKISYLAKASAYGATLGLIISIPLYYFLKVDGIVPTLILNSVLTLLCSWYFSRKIPYDKQKISIKEAVTGGKTMLKMGISMSLNSTLAALIAYVLRGYISHRGGLAEVGLYVAAFTIMETYVGMVFSAIGTDYYPRLTAVNQDNSKCASLMNQQGEIALLVLSPILMVCLSFMPVIILAIFSAEFTGAISYIMWAVIGMMAKLGAWIISYIFLAKAEARLFLINEVTAKAYMLGINLLGYYLYGLEGLGISFLIGFVLYFIQVYLIAKNRYDFHFNSSFITIYVKQLLLILLCFLCAKYFNGFMKYALCSLLSIVSIVYSYRELNVRIDLTNTIKSFINGRKHRT